MACPVHCHLFRSPWGCRAKVEWFASRRKFSSSHSASTTAATNCTNKLTQRITYLSHPNGTVWQPHIVHSLLGIRHINWTSARIKYMLNSLVSWVCPDGPSGSPVDPENPAYIIKTNSIVFLKTLVLCRRMGTYPYSPFGICLMTLNRFGADGSLSSQWS